MYSDGQLLSDPGRHKAQHQSSDGDAHPKPCSCHAARKVLAFAHFEHEFDYPASKRDLNAYVSKKEKGAQPGHSGVWEPQNSFFHTVVFALTRSWIRSPERRAIRLPERSGTRTQLQKRHADHHIIERVPLQMALCDHRSSNQRRHYSAQSIECVQKSKDFIWVRHVAHPRVPRRVSKTVAESRNHEDDH